MMRIYFVPQDLFLKNIFGAKRYILLTNIFLIFDANYQIVEKSFQVLLVFCPHSEMDFLNRQYHCKRITTACKYFHASAFYEKLPQFGLMCCACLCHVCATLKCDTLGHMSATNIASLCWLLAGWLG